MYLYDKLKEVIPNDSSNSPNSIKAIIITRSYILVAYHVAKPKVIMLSEVESSSDISSNQGRGALHNLLSQRQLSCLEEIYVDSIFQNYPQILDLQGYITGLINNASRLRYYGYINSNNAEEPFKGYTNALVGGLPDYSYALDRSRTAVISYVGVDNPTWYTRFNLRPDYYREDGPSGKLSAWFNRVRGIMAERHEQEIAQLESRGIAEAVVKLYTIDCNDIRYLSQLLVLSKAVSGINSPTTNVVCKAIQEGLSQLEVFPLGSTLLDTLRNSSMQPNKLVLSYYNKTGILQDKVSQSLSSCVERVKSGNGCLGIKNLIDKVGVKLIECAKNTKEGQLMCQLCISDMGTPIVDGDVKQTVKSMDTSTKVLLILGVCGFTPESLANWKGGNRNEQL